MLDSGCTQHITGDSKIFSSLDDNVVGYSDIIFGDNGRGKIKEIGTIAISSDHSLSKVLLVDSLNSISCQSLNFVILTISVVSLKMML